MEKKAVVGTGKLYYAVMTGTDKDGNPTYGEVKGGNRLIDISVKHNSETSSASAGDSIYLSTTEYGKTDVAVTIYDLTDEERCDFYGHKLDSQGGIIYSTSDVVPYVALMLEKTNMTETKKGVEYLTLFKGKMQEAEEKAKTKEEGKTEFQSYSISGIFENLESGRYYHFIDSNNSKFDATAWAKVWGKTVPTPTEATDSI